MLVYLAKPMPLLCVHLRNFVVLVTANVVVLVTANVI